MQRLIKFFLKLENECIKQNDFASAQAIYNALNSDEVQNSMKAKNFKGKGEIFNSIVSVDPEKTLWDSLQFLKAQPELMKKYEALNQQGKEYVPAINFFLNEIDRISPLKGLHLSTIENLQKSVTTYLKPKPPNEINEVTVVTDIFQAVSKSPDPEAAARLKKLAEQVEGRQRAQAAVAMTTPEQELDFNILLTKIAAKEEIVDLWFDAQKQKKEVVVLWAT